MTVSGQIIEASATAMLAMMTSMIESELKTNRTLMQQGVSHTSGQVRKIVEINGENRELSIRPQYVFGAISSISDRCNAEAEAVLHSACMKARGTVVEAVLRLIEPRVGQLKDSTYLKRFSVLAAGGLVCAKL